jgi:hypothetical protein
MGRLLKIHSGNKNGLFASRVHSLDSDIFIHMRGDVEMSGTSIWILDCAIGWKDTHVRVSSFSWNRGGRVLNGRSGSYCQINADWSKYIRRMTCFDFRCISRLGARGRRRTSGRGQRVYWHSSIAWIMREGLRGRRCV